MAAEISITIKNAEKRQTLKHLVYDDFLCNEEDPIIKKLIEDALRQFADDPEDIKIKIEMQVK